LARAFARNRQYQFFTLALPVVFLVIFASVFGLMRVAHERYHRLSAAHRHLLEQRPCHGLGSKPPQIRWAPPGR
jgi:hypothetical protein